MSPPPGPALGIAHPPFTCPLSSIGAGFKYVASGPLVRSSYKAGEVFMEAFLDKRDAERQTLNGAAEGSSPRSEIWSPEDAKGRKERVLSTAAPTAACPM